MAVGLSTQMVLLNQAELQQSKLLQVPRQAYITTAVLTQEWVQILQ